MTAATLTPPVERMPRGSGHLTVDLVSSLSTVTSVCATSPLKLLVPHSRGPSVWAYQSSFGGGLVAGDQTNLIVKLAPRTRCFLSTQASTKVYRNPTGRPCGHRLHATLEKDSLLVLAPDPVQAFTGSAYQQRQEFRLATGSGLVLLDWLSSGRVASGERWAFDSFQSRNDVFLDGERVFIDSLLLKTDNGSLATNPGFARHNCLATLLILGEPFAAISADILQEISSRPVTRRASLVCSASAVTHGTVIRLAGERVEEVAREIQQQLAFVSGFLHDDPWKRKW